MTGISGFGFGPKMAVWSRIGFLKKKFAETPISSVLGVRAFWAKLSNKN